MVDLLPCSRCKKAPRIEVKNCATQVGRAEFSYWRADIYCACADDFHVSEPVSSENDDEPSEGAVADCIQQWNTRQAASPQPDRQSGADDSAAFKAALKQTWKMVEPFAGEPGSYVRGQQSGMEAALRTIEDNYNRARAGHFPFATQQSAAVTGGAVIEDAIKHLTAWLDMGACDCEVGCRCGRTEVQRTRDALAALPLQAAAQQQEDERFLVEIGLYANGQHQMLMLEQPNGGYRLSLHKVPYPAQLIRKFTCEFPMSELRAAEKKGRTDE